MEPGRATPLTPSEIEEAFANAPHKREDFAAWLDSANKLHRSGDLPAIVWRSGMMEWYQHDNRHRGNGLPAFIQADGRMSWFEHDEKTGDQDDPPSDAVFPGQKTKSASKRQ